MERFLCTWVFGTDISARSRYELGSNEGFNSYDLGNRLHSTGSVPVASHVSRCQDPSRPASETLQVA